MPASLRSEVSPNSGMRRFQKSQVPFFSRSMLSVFFGGSVFGVMFYFVLTAMLA